MGKRKNRVCGADVHKDIIVATILNSDNTEFQGKFGTTSIELGRLKVPIVELEYRAKGHFTGRELFIYDPSGNRLEIRDSTWHKGMPEPSFEEIVAS